MKKRKVKILIPVTPPGFTTAILLEDQNRDERRFVGSGIPQRVERMDICRVGDVIEIDEEKIVRLYGAKHEDLANKYIAAGIAAPVSNSEKVTKKANYGEFENVESGPEEQNFISAKADGDNV